GIRMTTTWSLRNEQGDERMRPTEYESRSDGWVWNRQWDELTCRCCERTPMYSPICVTCGDENPFVRSRAMKSDPYAWPHDQRYMDWAMTNYPEDFFSLPDVPPAWCMAQHCRNWSSRNEQGDERMSELEIEP